MLYRPDRRPVPHDAHADAPPRRRAEDGPAAPFLRTLREIVDALSRPVPPRLIRQKKVPGKSGFSADYIHHTTVRDLLDHHAPGWLWSVRLYDAAGTLYVVGTLTLVGSDRTQARDGVGIESDSIDGYVDPSSNAEAQALRRAAMAHGLCRDLWRK